MIHRCALGLLFVHPGLDATGTFPTPGCDTIRHELARLDARANGWQSSPTIVTPSVQTPGPMPSLASVRPFQTLRMR